MNSCFALFGARQYGVTVKEGETAVYGYNPGLFWVVKEMLTSSLSHFPRHHRPLSQVARVLFSLCSF